MLNDESAGLCRLRLARSFSTLGEKIISYDELKKLIAQKPNGTLELFDVREPHEYSEGFIPTATNVPCLFLFLLKNDCY